MSYSTDTNRTTVYSYAITSTKPTTNDSLKAVANKLDEYAVLLETGKVAAPIADTGVVFYGANKYLSYKADFAYDGGTFTVDIKEQVKSNESFS